MESALAPWRQSGRISLWRYRKAPKMYRGWHFSADLEGCASLLRLLELLLAQATPAHRTLTITDPQIVRADRIFSEHDFKLEVPKKFRLCSGQGPDAGSVHFSASVFTMSLRAEDMYKLSGAVEDVSRNHADFGVGFGDDNTTLRFWWWPNGR